MIDLVLFLLARPQPHSVTLNWQDDVNPVGTTYNVYRAAGKCSVSSLFSRLNLAPITSKSFIDTNVAANTSYCYAATAVNASGESAYTPGVSATIPRK